MSHLPPPFTGGVAPKFGSGGVAVAVAGVALHCATKTPRHDGEVSNHEDRCVLDGEPATGLQVLRSGGKLSPPHGRPPKHSSKRALQRVPLTGRQVIRNGEKLSPPQGHPLKHSMNHESRFASRSTLAFESQRLKIARSESH